MCNVTVVLYMVSDIVFTDLGTRYYGTIYCYLYNSGDICECIINRRYDLASSATHFNFILFVHKNREVT